MHRIHTPNRPLLLVVAFAGLALASATLYRFPPARYAFYPQCPILALLHIQCPGCGSTRAIAALLRGHISEALRLNALTTSALPALIFYALYRSARALLGRPLPPLNPRPAMLYASLAVAALFTLVRNL